MKVLVVDDDPAAQRILKLFLERSGYSPIVLSDGSKVLDSALGPEPPPIIILDWMMPVTDGLEVLRRLRASKLRDRPYVLMLSSKSSKEDIAAGLDAGADDFVSKPFNVSEMQARLRVACRTYQYQRELQRQIEDNELLNQRNNLLSELISPPLDAGTVLSAHSASAQIDAAAKPELDHLVQFTDHEIRFLLSATLMELRLALEGAQPRTRKDELAAGDCCAWTTLLIPSQDCWVDMVIATRFENAALIFEKSLRRKPHNESEMLTLWSEIVRRIAQGFLRNLYARGGEILHPLMPRSQSLGVWRALPPLSPDCKTYDCIVDGQAFRLCLGTNLGAKLALLPSHLDELDVLAGPFPTDAVSAVPLFNGGVVLTPRFIDRIAHHAEHTDNKEPVLIYRPSPLARYFAFSS
ncbi:MAG: response regulator transcription factor [Opitutaceae bacterium]|jgi:CheY-like chemotaxis protein